MENTSSGPDNMTDNTTHDTAVNALQIFLVCFFLVILIAGLIGNALVIFLAGCRMKTTVISIWFLNLAISDFVFMLSTVTLFLAKLIWQSHFKWFEILSISVTLNLFASIYFLVVISLDRCLCTWMVVWAQNKRTLLRARIVCMAVWVLSIAGCFPFFNRYKYTVMFLDVYEFTVCFLIPFLIIASSHIAIGVRLRRLKTRKQFRSYRLIITVTLAFFICWFPHYVCIFYGHALNSDFSAMDPVFKIVFVFSFCLIYLNSCLNPILYVFMCDEYKKKLKQSLLLVLETVFAEDHLKLKAHVGGQRGQQKSDFTEMSL